MHALRGVVTLVAGLVMTSACWAEEKLAAQAQVQPAGSRVNQYSSEADIREGKLTVAVWCSLCHGIGGTGGRGPSLLSGRFRRGNSDQAIFKNIKDGIPGTIMRSNSDIPDSVIWQVVSYLRAATRPEADPVGSPKRGAEIFTKHACATCHWTGSEGGRRGPNFYTSAASIDYVRESILDPDANFRIAPNREHSAYQQVVIYMLDGRVTEGRWLNQNGYSLHFVDRLEDLRTVSIAEIDELFKPRRSLMPSFKDLLSARDLEDVIAYLLSIRQQFPE